MLLARSFSSAAAGALVAASILATTSAARADTLELSPSADATLFEPAFKDLQRASGAGQYLYVGRTNRDKLRRAVLHFDLASIPAGSIITAASLRVAITRTVTGAVDVGLYTCTASWGEGVSDSGNPGGGGTDPEPGDATWVHRYYPDVLWASPGGDFAPALLASATFGDAGTAAVWTSTPELVASVQSWLDAPETNFGWLVRHLDEETTGFAKQFGSSENEAAELRPTLTIEFTPPGGVECIADFNDDGIVNSTDVSDFINQWFQDQVDGTLITDWDGNGVVNSTDVSSFINDWFAAPVECTT